MDNKNDKQNAKRGNKRRIDELLNISNRFVRTKRHLEQNSEIASDDQLDHAVKIQDDREERMENLKNLIVNDGHGQDNQITNLKKRIQYSDGYIEHNEDDMDAETLENAKIKQEHRKEQLENLQK